MACLRIRRSRKGKKYHSPYLKFLWTDNKETCTKINSCVLLPKRYQTNIVEQPKGHSTKVYDVFRDKCNKIMLRVRKFIIDRNVQATKVTIFYIYQNIKRIIK